MKLLKLTLKNFKGVKSFTLKANGENISVMGDNATGKTTICDGLTWLLFDKDSLGRSKFDLKTLKDGVVVHKLEHSVEGEFSLDDASGIKLKKVYTETWPTKRGQATSSFSGHTTKYFVDDVPVKKTEYTASVEQIAKEDVFKLLTSPSYFAEQINWKERRDILLAVCGDITDLEVISSNEELATLPKILDGKTTDQAKKIITARRTLLNKELDAIPVRVDEVQLNMPDAPNNVDGIKARDKEIIELIDNHRHKKQRIESGGEIAEKNKALAGIDTEIIKIENTFTIKRNEKVGEIEKSIAALNVLVSNQNTKINEHLESQKSNLTIIKTNFTDTEALKKEWYARNDTAFIFEESSVCPTCKQYLPEEQVAASRATALESFNKAKASDLEGITARGVGLDKNSKVLEAANQGISKQVVAIEESREEHRQEIAALEVKKATALSSLPTKDNDPDYKDALVGKELIKKSIEDLSVNANKESTKIGAEIDKLNEERAEIKAKLDDVQKGKEGIARIAELNTQQKTYSAEFEKLEGHLYLIDLFTKTKVDLLEGKINSKFGMAKFKLFSEQINSGIAECCDVVCDGVPYSTGLNNAARINVGLDIIKTLGEHYKVSLPVFVDNAESVVKLHDIDSQLIRLVVSGEDKKLRVVTDKEIQEAA